MNRGGIGYKMISLLSSTRRCLSNRCLVGPDPHVGCAALLRWVEEFFSPWCKECEDCINRDRHECQCTTGTEEPSHCPELRDYIRYEGITLYGRARAVMDRSTKR